MECNEEELNENPVNNEEFDEQVETVEIDTSFETHYMKLEEILRNKSNRENILKQATENLQIYRQILIDQTEVLKKTRDENQYLSINIKFENQWRDKVVKRMIQTYDKLKIVTSSTNLVKSTIAFSENNQEKINQGKRQLFDQISFNKEKDDLKHEQLIIRCNLLSKELENEKLNKNKFEKHFETEIDDVSNKRSFKKQNINDEKIKIEKFNSENEMKEKKINAIVSDKDLLLKEKDAINFSDTKLQDTIKIEKMEYEEKIQNLNEYIETNNNCINNLEKDSDVIKEEINNEHKVLDKMNDSKSELDHELSIIEVKRNSYNEEIGKLKEIFESETNESNIKMNTLKVEINDKQIQITEMKNKYSNLKESHHALVNQIMSLESNNNQLDQSIEKLNDELKEKHTLYNRNKNSFENLVIKLKLDIQQEDLNKNIESELDVLEKEISELNNQHQNEKTNYDNVSNEARTKEINLNLEIDKLKETKQVLQTENEEAKTKIWDIMQKISEEIQRVQDEKDTKIMKLEEQTNIYQKETERVRQANEEKYKQELNQLQEIGNNLNFKISEFQMKKQNLDKELAMRFEELGKIREDKEMVLKQREIDFIEEAEKEVMIIDTPVSKKSLSTKKDKFTKAKLPNLKIPKSKYSSTSLSDSSICSLEDTTSLKRKLDKQKTPRETLPTKLYENTQKSLDEIFNSLREETTETTMKKPKTKGSYKPRKTLF